MYIDDAQLELLLNKKKEKIKYKSIIILDNIYSYYAFFNFYFFMKVGLSNKNNPTI